MSARSHLLTFALPLSPEDVVRHALAAYYRARLDQIAPVDYPEPEKWGHPREFLGLFLHLFEVRVQAQAHQAGVPDLAHAVELLHAIDVTPPYCEQHVSDVDPELWVQMQQGGAK